MDTFNQPPNTFPVVEDQIIKDNRFKTALVQNLGNMRTKYPAPPTTRIISLYLSADRESIE